MRDRDETRRGQLKLARQRPGPDRMRARARAAVEDQPRSWWRRIPWVVIGAVFTAVAGVGSLAFTGIATYYDARVSADQLHQSQEDAEQESRGQAMRVSFWTDTRGPKHELRIHVMNRSPDPIYRLIVWMEGDLAGNGQGRKMLELSEPSLAPCSEMVFNAEDLRFFSIRAFPLAPTRGLTVEGLMFNDRDGELWVRTEEQLATHTEARDISDPWMKNIIKIGIRRGGVLGTPQLKAAESCDSVM
ncbi:hypothetical protein [Streptomyces sp. NBC_01262]|uniref:hypothetical protein n=1 Tax=Streptomyces sp. NBC_01262 TaxID=2903803 RepID=UPI002E36DA77|nr:hypothetical protein [Streptomyces sp. NBC_01262]